MKAKKLFKAILTIALFGYCSLSASAQVQYATSVTGSNRVSNAGLTSAQSQALAVDGNLATGAHLTTVTALGIGDIVVADNGFIELKYPAGVTSGTTSYIKVNMEENQLAALLGGTVGNLLNAVLGVVLGQQYLEVAVRNGGGLNAYTTYTDFNGPNLKIVQGANGDFYIKLKPGVAYDRIKITNRLNGLLATRYLDVYDAFYVTGASSCTIGNYTSFDGGGIVTIGDANVHNANYAIDGNLTNYSRINLGTLGVGQYLQQIIYFDAAGTTSDTYNIKFQIDSGLVNLGVLGNIRIVGYNGTSEVYNKPLTDDAFINLNIGAGLAQNAPVSIAVQPGVVLDRIAVRYTGLVNVGALVQELHLYGVVRGNFGVTLAGAGSYQVGATIPLVATVTGCTGPYTYSWTGSGATASTTSTASPVLNTPGTYTYTVKVKDKYGIEQTATATVIIEAQPAGGTISSAQTVCSGYLASDLTLSGYTGNIIGWQKATDQDFTAPVNIANTAGLTTLTGSSLGVLTATTYIRAVVGRFTYNNTTSPAIELTVKGTTWNGTAWSAGEPDIATTAYFTGNYNLDTDLSACKIEVSNNAVVNIPSDNLVTVQHNVKVVSGSFTLQNNAHLLQQSEDANIGNITVKKKGSALFRLDYTLWSSPVEGQQLGSFSPWTNPTRFFEYGKFDVNNVYQEKYFVVMDLTTNFAKAKSYLIRMPNTVTGGPTGPYYAGTQTLNYVGSFTGVPHNGTITYPLSTNGLGYTAVGNPYPSPINVQAFFDANQSVLDPSSALYFWRKKNDTDATSYCTLTRDAYVYNHAEGGVPGEEVYGGMQWDDFFNNDVDPADWVINPGQGFFVQAANFNNLQLTFNNAMRRGAIYNNQYFRTAETPEAPKSRLWLNLTGAETAFSQAALVYSSTATLGIDSGRDGALMDNNNTVALYSVQDDNSLTIQARPSFTDDDIVPMGYRANNAGQYSISLHRKDGVFTSQAIFIKDNLLGVTKEITNAEYTFTTDAGTFNNRFEVVYKLAEALGTNNPELAANNVIVYKQDTTINITAGTAEITEVNVYDMRGRKLYGKTDVNATQTSITNLNVQKEVIIIEVTTVNGKVSKKIIF